MQLYFKPNVANKQPTTVAFKWAECSAESCPHLNAGVVILFDLLFYV